MVEQFLGEEEEVVESFEDAYITNTRIIKYSTRWGQKEFQSIQLEDVIGLSFERSFPILEILIALVFPTAGIIATIYGAPIWYIAIGLGIGALLGGVAFLSIERGYKVVTANNSYFIELPPEKESKELMAVVKNRIDEL